VVTKLKSKVISAGIWYTVGNMLIKGINFLSLPLFSRLLNTEEFGIYNVFVSYEAILYVIIGMAIHSSIRSANIKFKGNINEYTSSVSIIYLVNAMIMLFIALIFNKQLSKLLAFDKLIIVLLIFYSLGSALLSLYNNYISLEYSYKKYLLVSFFNSVGNVCISLVLILTIFKKKRDIGRIVGATSTICILAFFILCIMYKKAKPKINKSYWKFAVKYSIPIVPHGISQVLLAQFDRIMIRSIVGNAAAGIYSLAGNIMLILTIITDSISTAWSTWFYDQISENRIESINKRAKQLSFFFVVLTVGLLTISPELIIILGGKEYSAGQYVAIPMIVDAFILFIYNIIVSSEYYKNKTTYIMLGTMVAMVINLITNYVFISKYGFIAAAYTTLFSYMCYLILHIVISHKVVGFFVLELKFFLMELVIIILTAIFDLLFIRTFWLRVVVGISITIPIIAYLLKETKIYKKIL
jgi:O-antigen/teichoic acid export membrane protein